MPADAQHQNALVEAFRGGTALSYKKGEFIIRPGESPQGVFYIEEGLVKAYDITKYGEENLLIIRKEHEIFPLIWSITGKGRHVIYEALSPVKVYRLDQKTYQKLLKESPDLMGPLLEIVLEMYRIHSERIINLEYRTVRERLISFLLIMAERFGEKSDNGEVCIKTPLRQQDIASSINASRETTGRELSYLSHHNLVSMSQSVITLKDLKKLRDYL